MGETVRPMTPDEWLERGSLIRTEKEGREKQRQYEEEENAFRAQAGRDTMTLEEHDEHDFYGRFTL